MLNEPGAFFDDERSKARGHARDGDDIPPVEDEQHYFVLQERVAAVMDILAVDFPEPDHPMQRRGDLIVMDGGSKLIGVFRGRLIYDSQTAYNELDYALAAGDLFPMFRHEDGIDVIYVVVGRPSPAQGGGRLSLILFVLTILSVLFVGTQMALAEISQLDPQRAAELTDTFLAQMWRGFPYAASILLILGAHEMGHYLASRYHRVAASLPYFIPFPLGLFGTFGAAIRLREPMRNRKMLLDIGAAGPIAGMIFAVPIVLIGLSTSDLGPITIGGLTEGNSILYALAKIITFGRFVPSEGVDVYVNQLAWAGWTGLFVTGLNLIPLGQLDGGHVMYALIGRRARMLYYPAILAMGALVIFTNSPLVVVLVMLILIGRVHATPLDDITPLDKGRKFVALFTLLIFVLVFVPIPLVANSGEALNLDPAQSISLTLLIVWMSRRQLMPRWFS